MTKKFSVCIILLFLFSPVLAEEPYALEKIVVTPSSSGYNKATRQDYSVKSVSAEEFSKYNLNSLSDLLEYVTGMDLRNRSTFGIQGDLSLRGSTFEQVAVLIDGVKVMDPQTGHHNLDIPLTNFDVERVEVISEGMSSLYGAGAFAGSVNIITKKPLKRGANIDLAFGENALFTQAFSVSVPVKDYRVRVSVDHKVAKSARPNTDFENSTASFYLNKDFQNFDFDTLFGYQKKDFGADSFYSNLFPEEEEHTETIFAKAGFNPKASNGAFKNNLFFRKHRDKFILRRNNPTSVNYHTTYVYGLDSTREFSLAWGNASAGLDIGEDEIFSTNLGKHTRLHEAAAFGFNPDTGDRLSLDFRTRVDYYQHWQAQESFNSGISYKVRENLRLGGSFGRAFRIPSFTELYYSDAANKGNPNLKIEKSDTLRIGLYSGGEVLGVDLEGFWRRGKNLIDFTRATVNDIWQATNLGRVDFKGMELNLRLKPDWRLNSLCLDRMIFSYAHNDADKKASGFLSKYALDILRHQLLLNIESRLFGLNLNWQFSYNQRYYGETYFIGNISLSKRIKRRNFVLEPFIRIDNFSNTQYSEISGVLQPPRWIKSGLKFEW